MARWIHEFRSTGERALAEGERLALRRRAFRLRVKSLLLGALVVVALFGALMCLAFAAGGPVGAWVGLIPLCVLAGYALSWANAAEKLALLHRRSLRLGTVEGFRRVPGDETARRLWSQVGVEVVDPEEGEEDRVRMPRNEYWSVDERFEEALAACAGGKVDHFDAVGRDGAILWVEGKPVRKLLEPPVWEAIEGLVSGDLPKLR